jgi:anti-sigma factor RsiW
MVMESACESYQMLLSAYADGEASPKERGQLELHLSGCSECRARLEDLKALSSTVSAHLLAEAEQADFSGFADGVLKRIGPKEPGLLERLQVWVSEVMTYHRAAVLSSAITAAVTIAIAVPVVWQLASRSAPQAVVVRDLQLQDPNLQPVVMDMGDGKTLIMLVDRPGSDEGEAAPDQDQEELDTTPPTGGEL